MNDKQKEFVDGFTARLPNERAPEWLKMKVSLKREALIAWLQNRNDEWVNIDVKLSKKGTLYGEVNNWKKEAQDFVQGGEWEGRSMAYESLKATGDQKDEEIDFDSLPF